MITIFLALGIQLQNAILFLCSSFETTFHALIASEIHKSQSTSDSDNDSKTQCQINQTTDSQSIVLSLVHCGVLTRLTTVTDSIRVFDPHHPRVAKPVADGSI